jgi:thioesterase domain-containing protein
MRQSLGTRRISGAAGRRGALAAGLALAACAPAGELAAPAGRGRVVLLRGLFNVFSTGLDALASRMRAAGYDAQVYNHLAWTHLAEVIAEEAQAVRLPRPFALAGHSLGADDALRLAGALGTRGVRADFVFTYDTVLVNEVPAGPHRAVNYFQTGGTWGLPLRPAPGFEGEIENIALSPAAVTHSDIDENASLHADTIARLDAFSRPRVV